MDYSHNFHYVQAHQQKFLLPVISKNAHVANHENMFIGVLADEAKDIISLSMKRFSKARSFMDSNSAIRQFVISDLNVEVKNCKRYNFAEQVE